MKTSRAAFLLPVLAAAYPIIDRAAKNVDRVGVQEILRPLGASILLGLLLFGLSWLLLRDRAKASVLSFLLLALVFSFVQLRSFLLRIVPALTTTDLYQTHESIATLVVSIVIAAVACILLRRTKRSLSAFAAYLTLLAAVLIALPAASIGRYAVFSAGVQKEVRRWDAKMAAESRSARTSAPDPAPDIYYIILDMYASPDVQKDVFGYDDGEFVRYLTGKGFYVAEDSHCNYPYTLWSLASSLNFQYLGELSRHPNSNALNRVLHSMIRDNRAVRLLKKAGYEFVLLNSCWEVSTGNDRADLVLPQGGIQIGEMERVLLEKSVFDIWWKGSVPYLNPYVKRCFDCMETMPQVKGPKFVFAHFVCPHPPWLFDPQGNQPADPSAPQRPPGWRRNYTDQVRYVNKRVKAFVDRLLSDSKTPPIIIIQGDHGAYSPEFHARHWENLTDRAIEDGFRSRVSILNAYYFPAIQPSPGKQPSALYASISPVNTFRVLLNQYFGYHFKLLDDVSYIPKNGQCREDVNPGALRPMGKG